MKNLFYRLVCFCTFFSAFHGPLTAQWIPQAVGQFDLYDWVDQIRITDASNVWAGITNFNVYSGSTTDVLPRLCHTLNGGLSWDVLTIPGTENYLGWGLSLLGADTAFWSLNRRSSPNDRLYRTTDGGQSWELILQDATAGYQVHFFDALHGLVYRGPYGMKITSDGGQTWKIPTGVPAGLANQGIFNYPGSDTEVEGQVFLAGLEDGKFFKTTDFGNTWTAYLTPLSTPLSELAFESESTGLAASMFTVYNNGWTVGGKSSRLIRTTDGGQTWTEIPRAQLPLPDTTLFIQALAATGAPNEYYMEAKISNSYDEITFRSTDGGWTWEEVSFCPDEPLGVLEFKSPDLGWAGNALVQSGAEGMFFKWGIAPAPLTTFTVDLGSIPASPNGVHLALDLNNWDPAAVPMTNISGTIWEAKIALPSNTTVQYRFVNGLSLAEAEQVPEACGAIENGSVVRVTSTGPCKGTKTLLTKFGHCIPDGELNPQGNPALCDTSYIVCDNFDSYTAGKLGPQSSQWKSYGCNYDEVEGDACDVDLNGFATGFTNYSGNWAMHLNGLYDASSFQGIELSIDTLKSGAYEMAMKLYFPNERFGGIYILFNETGSSIDLAFNPDATVAYSKWNGTDFSYVTEAMPAYPINKWFDLKLVFDLDAHTRAFWLENTLIFNKIDTDMTQLFAPFFQTYGSNGEMFVDNFTLRKLNAVPTLSPENEKSLLQLSPNPASEMLRVELPLALNRQDLVIRLLDQQGRVMEQVSGTAVSHVFRVAHMPPGVYGIMVQDQQGALLEFSPWIKN